MTEYDRGRAAMLAEAVKVAEDARDLRERLFEQNGGSSNAHMARQADDIATALRALSTSPGEHVLVKKADLERISALSAPSQYRMPDETLVNLRVVNDLTRAMLSAKE